MRAAGRGFQVAMGRHEEVEFSWAVSCRADGPTDAFVERHGI